MGYHFSFLDKDHFSQIHQTFLAAFADYQVDMSYLTMEVLELRMLKNAVDYEASVGVFEGQRMVGFTLIAIDEWRGILSAFDAGTGIVKDCRGKGLAREMFNFAHPKLKKQGVSKFILEVIQDNEPAVKAYSKSGFLIVRELDCFELILEKANLESKTDLPLKILSVGKDTLDTFRNDVDWEPSWENSFSAIDRIFDHLNVYGAFLRGEPVGLIVHSPDLNWIMSLVVKQSFRRRGVGTRLLEHFAKEIVPGLKQVKLLNVDHSDTGMREFLETIGFQSSVRQYEMKRAL